MPSFDVVSRFNFAEPDTSVNTTARAVAQRFDFRGARAEIAVDRTARSVRPVADDATKRRTLREMVDSAVHRRGLDLRAFRWREPQPAAGGKLKAEATLRDGLDRETARQVVRAVKDSRLKVQVSVQGEEVRVSGRPIDDLQAVIRQLGTAVADVPLQFVNMRPQATPLSRGPVAP
jgi:uncharacterized protein YajQ (UPF0234 family)